MRHAFSAVLLAAMILSPLAAQEGEKKRPTSVGGLDQAGGTISGIVKFTGDRPPVKPIKDITGNAYCNEHCQGKAPLEEKWVVNVLVYVSKGLEGKKFSPPKEPVALDQVGCVYTPHVVGVMVGQMLQVRNSDSTLHNVIGNLKANKAFNEGMSVKGATIDKIFQNPEFKADFRCFMHPWMVAYVHVLDHPYFAITGPDGTFMLKGLPPGEYEIAALHESSRFEVAPERVSVKIGAGESKKLEFVFRDPK
jgi:plastocyanin